MVHSVTLVIVLVVLMPYAGMIPMPTTVLFDLVVAIEIGMVLACLLFIKRMSEETHVDSWVYTDDDTPDINEQPMRVMKKAGFVELVGEENFRPNISAALKRAEEVI